MARPHVVPDCLIASVIFFGVGACGSPRPGPTEVALAAVSGDPALSDDASTRESQEPRHVRSEPLPPAPSSPPPRDISGLARAQSLFEEGKAAMATGNLTLACEKLAQSHALDPAVGTLLNLAKCQDASGDRPAACASLVEAAGRVTKGDARDQYMRTWAASIGCALP